MLSSFPQNLMTEPIETKDTNYSGKKILSVIFRQILSWKHFGDFFYDDCIELHKSGFFDPELFQRAMHLVEQQLQIWSRPAWDEL